MYNETNPIRVVVADDHALFRAGVVNLLEDEPDITIVAQTSNGSDAVKIALEKKPNVVLMDIEMPHLDGLEAMMLIKRESPGTKILILTGYGDESNLLQSLKLGADGCVLKTEPEEQVIEAVRKVARGVPGVSEEVSSIMVNELRQRDILAQELSGREIEVLNMTGAGLSSREIAKKLHISESTARTYLKRLMQKLHLYTRKEVIDYANRQSSWE